MTDLCVICGRRPDHLHALTEREREILTGLAEGLSLRSIADRVFVSESTVKTQTADLYRKLRVHTAAQAVGIAYQHGLLGLTVPCRHDQAVEDLADIAHGFDQVRALDPTGAGPALKAVNSAGSIPAARTPGAGS